MEASLDKKFYVPELSEFYVGFECETTGSFPELPRQWKKCEIYKETMSLFMSWHPKYGPQFRVKYLTKEDIESFGFIHSGLNNSIYLYKDKLDLFQRGEKYGTGLNWNEGINHILVFYIPDPTNIPAGINLFVGNIKNKSELKVLLKQLNILT